MNKRTTTGIALITATTLHLTTTPAHATPTPTTPTTTTTALQPLTYKLSLKLQPQQTSYYCVPAASSMSLSTFGITASQTTLAKKMKTTKTGTKGSNATPVLNTYVAPLGYTYTSVTDVAANPATLMNRLTHDIGILHRAPTLAVWMEKLPWNKGKIKGKHIGHAMIAYGYNTLNNTITVYDPWKPTGGTHTITARTLAATLQETGGMRYITKR
ncbi:C39 family peptidase [Nonomuraea sp. NPDC050643]|uniref:C39 family peptidase n=1 Tax=Nonomuraea sp. NPDC050643 TaxID=3155660 RepID=UPI0033FD1D62